MIIVEKNTGPKIDYELDGYRLYFGDDEMMMRLDRYQKDWPVHIDICKDEDGNLVVSTDAGRYYVAEIDIPEAQYTQPEDEDEEPQKIPLDTDTVTLTLWALV